MLTAGFWAGLDLRTEHLQAGGRGFEPRLTDPESAVLPLDEPPVKRGKFYHRSCGSLRVGHPLEQLDRALDPRNDFGLAQEMHRLDQRRAYRLPGDRNAQDPEELPGR